MTRANVLPIVGDHWRGLHGSGGIVRRWTDVAINILVPLAAGVATYLAEPTIDRSDVGALLAVVGILTGLLFQLLVSVLSSLHEEAKIDEPPRSIEDANHYLDLLEGLDANVSYSVLVGCVTAGGLGFGLLFGNASWEQVGAALVAVALVHFGLSLMIVLKRYRAMSIAAANQARKAIWRTRQKTKAS